VGAWTVRCEKWDAQKGDARDGHPERQFSANWARVRSSNAFADAVVLGHLYHSASETS
jgi:hypothetical protein